MRSIASKLALGIKLDNGVLVNYIKHLIVNESIWTQRPYNFNPVNGCRWKEKRLISIYRRKFEIKKGTKSNALRPNLLGRCTKYFKNFEDLVHLTSSRK